MKYVELYENYSSESKNPIEDIVSNVMKFISDNDTFRESGSYRRFIAGESKKYFWGGLGNPDVLSNVISYLTRYKYKFETYPKLSEYDLKVLSIHNKLNFSDSIGWNYGPCIVINDDRIKLCIYLNPDFKFARFYKLDKDLILIKTSHATPDEIDCIFWNGIEIVDAEFNVIECYPDDDEKAISHSDYESIKTSDGKEYDANGTFVPDYVGGADGVILDVLIITKKN
jgi:hypothetical protein